MNRSMIRTWPAVVLAFLSTTTAAIDIEWYEQRAPGRATGEVRLANLGTGEINITTPGRRMEFGIVRYGDVAVVMLSETAGKKPASSVDLVVVATQDGQVVRQSFALEMPAAVTPAGAEQPPRPLAAETAVAVPTESSPVQASVRVPEPSAAVNLQVRPEVQVGTREPETALPATAAATPVALANQQPPIAVQPTATCRIIAIRPGSLRKNVQRLLGECGARMGEWVMPGGDEWSIDWKVHDPRILTEQNLAGLTGLLELLHADYRLQGLPNPSTAAIDIYMTE